MKYLKLLDNWSSRYGFLEGGPSRFVCYFPNGINDNLKPFMWYHTKGTTDEVNGYEYVFIETNVVKDNNTTYTINLDKPLVTDINLTTAVKGYLNGVSVEAETISYAPSGATTIQLNIPTTFSLNGQTITIQDGDNLQLYDFDFSIEYQTTYSNGIIILTN